MIEIQNYCRIPSFFKIFWISNSCHLLRSTVLKYPDLKYSVLIYPATNHFFIKCAIISLDAISEPFQQGAQIGCIYQAI